MPRAAAAALPVPAYAPAALAPAAPPPAYASSAASASINLAAVLTPGATFTGEKLRGAVSSVVSGLTALSG